MWKVFYPHFLIESVVELTPERLRTLGIEDLLLDVDCTLKRYSNQEPEPDVQAWLESLKAENFRLCLLSNGRGKRISQFAELVDIPFIAEACKPFQTGCRRAFTEYGFDPEKTALVGDQIFADVMAGRLAGIRTFRATPLSPEEERWFTRIKRPIEKIVLRSFRRKFPDGVWKKT
jgi:HAD superfamily phosphatase (TIGR01668 family)